jgi:lipid A ethanolaminephosphotransferase
MQAKPKAPRPHVSVTGLCAMAALYFVFFDNAAFFGNVAAVYPPSPDTFFDLALTAAALYLATLFLLLIFCTRHTIKPVLVVLFPVTAIVAYFCDSYHVFIDDTMIRNILETNPREIGDLLTGKLFIYFLLLGVAPSLFVCRCRIVAPATAGRRLLLKTRALAACLIGIVVVFFSSSAFFTSVLREHKPLRYYSNPAYYLYSSVKYLLDGFSKAEGSLEKIGKDAGIPDSDADRELVILVVGEAARADRFSLNGYRRETNPLLKRETIINFPNMTSCGTTTAISVPCMFSCFDRSDFSRSAGDAQENLLDILSRAGVSVLWRDNNSSSKGVADRVAYQDFSTPETNPACDTECRDIGMLAGLQAYIDSHATGDILVVLHQMGNHGPAYYKRYPEKFERFTPVCRTNELSECSPEAVGNAYDNAILYTDTFLSRVIALLKENDDRFETAMLYASDHGESLGESGLYLHGLPYLIAPQVQKHIAAVFWFGRNFDIDTAALRRVAGQPFSHDHLFHTILGLFEIESSVYIPALDIIAIAKSAPGADAENPAQSPSLSDSPPRGFRRERRQQDGNTALETGTAGKEASCGRGS